MIKIIILGGQCAKHDS